MNKMYFKTVCQILLLVLLEMLVTTGCNRVGERENTPEVIAEAPAETQSVSIPTIQRSTSPDHIYPSPIIGEAPVSTQDIVQYPGPVEQTLPVSSPSLKQSLPTGDLVGLNPYPLQETPEPQAVYLATAFPYPPPVKSAPANIASVAPGTIPANRYPSTPTAQYSTVATGTNVPTPAATTVKIRFIPSDPTIIELAAGRLQLVVFFADWCTYCKSVAPVVLGLESQYKDRMNFIYLDVDDKRTLTFQKNLLYSLIARPRIYLIDGEGGVLRDWTGYVPLEELQQAIETSLPVSP